MTTYRVKTEDIARAARLAASVADARSPRPAFSCAALDFGEGRIAVYATDGETAIRTSIQTESGSSAPRSVCDAAKLAAVVGKMEDDYCTLSTSARAVTVTGGGSWFDVASIDADTFPSLDLDDESTPWWVNGQDLARVLSQSLPCSAAEVSRYAINGVLLSVNDGFARAVCTDGRRLAVATYGDTPGGKASVILSRKSASLVAKLADSQESVLVRLSSRSAHFTCGDVSVSCCPLEGTFPNYEAVIPTEFRGSAKVNRDAILSAISHVVTVCDRAQPRVIIECKDGAVALSAKSDCGHSAHVEVKAECTEVPPIGFNPRYLSDAIRAAQSDTVTILFSGKESGSQKPVVIDSDGLRCVVMPVSL